MASMSETSASGAVPRDENVHIYAGMSAAKRALIACSGAALCMAAGGLWLIPSDDAAMQLIKLFASVVMGLGGLILFNGLNNDIDIPEVQIDPNQRVLRIYEYDSAGRSVLKAWHNIDDLQALSVEKRRLQAKGRDGRLLLDIPLHCVDQANAVRGLLPRAS